MNSAAHARTSDAAAPLNCVAPRRNLRSPFIAPRDTVELQISLLWEKLLRVRPIGLGDDFFELGGDSLLAERLIADVRQITGRSFALSNFLEKPTVEHLTGMIKRTRWSPNWSSLVSVKPVGSRPPLFFVHAPRGYVFLYYDVIRHLGSDQPVYGFQAVGVDRDHTPHFSLHEMAAHYIREMRALQPDGPYHLCGFCLGGIVAFEMAQQLRAQDCRVELLALIDAYPRIKAADGNSRHRAGYVSRIRTKTKYHVQRFLERSTKDKFRYLVRRIQNVGLLTKIVVWNRVYDYYRRKGRRLPAMFHDVYMINVRALLDYEPRPYPGQVTLLTSESVVDEFVIDPERVWNQYAAGGLDLYTLPCDHENLLSDPNARLVAKILRECLDRKMVNDSPGRRSARVRHPAQ